MGSNNNPIEFDSLDADAIADAIKSFVMSAAAL
jgi:hypothetical protein